MRQFFIIVFAFILGGCNSAKDIGGMYHLISDDPALQRVSMVTVVPDGLVLMTSDQTTLVFKYR